MILKYQTTNDESFEKKNQEMSAKPKGGSESRFLIKKIREMDILGRKRIKKQRRNFFAEPTNPKGNILYRKDGKPSKVASQMILIKLFKY